MHTEVHSESGRVIVISDIADNESQSFTVAIRDPADWQEMHDYIINENDLDGIPNRRIDCTAEMPFSTKRAVYQISVEEAEVLRQHPKVEWVEESSTYNPTCLEQRKYDEKFDRHADKFRFKDTSIRHLRAAGTPGSDLDFTQWGLHRHGYKNDPFGSETNATADIKYQFTGKNVDVVIMDTGIRWDHPEFLKPGVTTFVDKNSTRVRDILIHGASEYGIDWEAEGLIPAGQSTYSNYTVANVLESSTFGNPGSWHGSHVGGTAAGNQFGAAFEANIWSIACVDRSDVGWAEPSDGFDYIKVWHKNKPINPETGKRNPTIVNCSWGHRQFIRTDLSSEATFRGVSYGDGGDFYRNEAYDAIYYLDYTTSVYKGFTTRRVSGQTIMNELLDDPDCQGVVFICSAGNSDHKQDTIGGIDYNNRFTSGSLYYSTAGYDSYFHRGGTPAVGHEGAADAVISVAALSEYYSNSQETLDSYTNRGPRTDISAAGGEILSPWDAGYDDPRDTSFHNNYLQGTSMAAPNVTGVLALYLQSRPDATRVDARNWLFDHGSIVAPLRDSEPDFTDSSYWGSSTALRNTIPRVLFNPFANNERVSIVPGVEQIIKENLVMELDGEKEEIVDNIWRDTSRNGSNNLATLDPGVDYFGDRYSYQFNGNAKASIANNSDFQSIGEFTIELWYNQHTHSLSNVYPTVIFGSWNALEVDDNEFAIYQQPDGTLTYELAGGSANSGITSTHQTTPQLNTWNHVVLTRTSNKIDFYLNKEKTTYQGIYSPNITCTLEARVGTDNSTGDFINRVTGISAGSGYETVPTVNVVNPGGATGATFVASLSTQGTFKRFEVTSGGSGYTYPPVVTLGGGMADVGATAAITAGVVTSISLDGIVYDTTNSDDIFQFGSGTSIASNGSGNGEQGGFDIGGTHLRFGDSDGGIRAVVVNPVDATDFDTIRIYAIRGDDFNGGELPEGDSGDESLRLSYNIGAGVTDSWTDAGIIIWHEGLDGTYGNPGGDLRNWDISIPGIARTDNVYFRLYMPNNSGTIYDNYGILSVSFIDEGTEYTDSTVTLTPNALESNPSGITTATANVWINKNITDIELTDGGSGYGGTYALSMSGGNPTSPGSGQAVADGNLYYDGYVGMVRYYKGRPFIQDEVNQHYEEQIARFDPSKKPSISFGNSDPSTDASLADITTTGLVMHIDGPTKFDTDLSGNGNVPTYYSDNPYNGLSYLNFQGTTNTSGGGLLSGVNISGGSFAMEAWIYLLGDPNSGTNGQIVSQDDGGNDGQGWQWRISDAPDYQQDFVYFTSSSRGSAVDLSAAPTPIPLNKWSHVAVTYDGTDIRMYLNGVQDFIHTPASSLYASSTQIGIGRYGGTAFASSYRLNARYGAVRLYNQFLTGDQIKSHYDLQKYRFIPQSLTLSYE